MDEFYDMEVFEDQTIRVEPKNIQHFNRTMIDPEEFSSEWIISRAVICDNDFTQFFRGQIYGEPEEAVAEFEKWVTKMINRGLEK